LLLPIVARQKIGLYNTPETEKELSKCMERLVGTEKRSWLDLEIVDVCIDKHIFIFGRKRFIFRNLKKIAEVTKEGKGFKTKDISISFDQISFSLADFI